MFHSVRFAWTSTWRVVERVAKACNDGQHASLVQARRLVDISCDEVVFTLGVPSLKKKPLEDTTMVDISMSCGLEDASTFHPVRSARVLRLLHVKVARAHRNTVPEVNVCSLVTDFN